MASLSICTVTAWCAGRRRSVDRTGSGMGRLGVPLNILPLRDKLLSSHNTVVKAISMNGVYFMRMFSPLRSADVHTCTVPRTQSRLGDRSFGVAGPRLWNSLPAELRQQDICFTEFRRLLKTFLQGVSIACYAERCISYDRFCPTVWPSVCHTPVSCQNHSS